MSKEGVAVLLYAADVLAIGDAPMVDTAIAHTRRVFADGFTRGHDGDCTKQPHTCSMCLVEKYIKAAEVVIASDDDIPETLDRLPEVV